MHEHDKGQVDLQCDFMRLFRRKDMVVLERQHKFMVDKEEKQK